VELRVLMAARTHSYLFTQLSAVRRAKKNI